MSFGIEVYNTNGNLQISESYSNYQQIASGTISSANANGGSTTFSYTAQTSGTYPLVFARPHSDGVYVGGCFFGDSVTGLTANTFYLTSSGAYDYRVYGLNGSSTIDSSTFAMQVFDGSGNVIWDSRKPQAQVQATVTATTVWPSSGPMDPYDNPSVPITLSYTSFSQRPWILMNNLVNWGFAGGNGCWAAAINPSANTSSILLSNGTTNGSGAWVANTSNGSSGVYTQGFAGGQCIVALAICY